MSSSCLSTVSPTTVSPSTVSPSTVSPTTVRPSDTGVGACRVCGRAHVAIGPLCFCCRTVAAQLRLPLVPLVALTEYRVGDRSHRRFRAYKDAPVSEVRARCRGALVDGLARWVDAHGVPWHTPGTDDPVVTTVPSSHRPGEAPIAGLVDDVPALARQHLPLLVRGPARLGHLQAHREAFAPAPGVDRAGLTDLTVVVIDDTTTTGAAAQSAAAALRLAGARVVGVLVLGRALAPRAELMDT